jgi:hypothetical protein
MKTFTTIPVNLLSLYKDYIVLAYWNGTTKTAAAGDATLNTTNQSLYSHQIYAENIQPEIVPAPITFTQSNMTYISATFTHVTILL